MTVTCSPFSRHFNPRSREGSDAHAADKIPDPPISIHAPVKGATSLLQHRVLHVTGFQSTLP